ncbi:MAG: DUF748 domain-containing protein [Colwellia sp.]|nr:DUF748 domain-containing protein [Colwellia sp.]
MKSWMMKFTVFISMFFICLYSLIWLITPTATRFYSSDILELALNENDLFLSEASSVRYNPFLSHLSIYDLTLTKGSASGEAVLVIEELHLEVSLYKLIVDQFQITEFQINGLFLSIKINGDDIEVAGIPLNNSASEAIQTTDDLKEEASAIIVKMAQFHLYDADIQINVDNNQHSLVISSLGIERVHASQKDQSVGVILDAKFDDAPLTVSLSAQLKGGIGDITSYVSLTDLELGHFSALLPEAITSLNGRLSAKSEQKVTITENSTTIAMRQVDVKIEQLNLHQGDIHIKFDKHRILSNDIDIELVPEHSPKIVAKATMEVDNFSSSYLSQEQVLAQFNKLKLADITITVENQQHTVEVNDINLLNAAFSDDTNNDILPFMLFNRFDIKNLTASEQGLAIELVTMSGFSIDAQLNENKELVNLITLPEVKEQQNTIDNEPTVEATLATNEQSPAFSLNIGQFRFLDDGHINFIDNSVAPLYKRHFTITKLTAGPVNNQQVETKTLFELVGSSEQYAHFNFSGFSQPFAPLPVHHIEGAFKEISLPAVSTYMKDALQYVFDSGQLDLSLKTTVTGDDIDGSMGILMRGLELTAAEDDEVDSISDQTAIPFSIALGMLKDRDGNVELDIPLSGKTSDPSFGISGFITLLIKQATMSAAQDYLMTTFVPYANVISIAMTAGDFLLKIRFNDLEFPATQTALQPNHNAFLSEFSALLEDKPDEHITLCAIGTAADIGKPAGSELSKVDSKKLKVISLARMNNFKNYMVNTHKLASSRLLLCTPQVDSSKEAKPRITFTN